MKDFSWVPKSLCAIPIPERDWGVKINIAQINNTTDVSVPPWKPGAKICFSYQKPAYNTDLCNTQK